MMKKYKIFKTTKYINTFIEDVCNISDVKSLIIRHISGYRDSELLSSEVKEKYIDILYKLVKDIDRLDNYYEYDDYKDVDISYSEIKNIIDNNIEYFNDSFLNIKSLYDEMKFKELREIYDKLTIEDIKELKEKYK